DRPVGTVGRARTAMRRRAWDEALPLWDEALGRFGAVPDWSWFAGRAWVLFRLRRLDDAEACYRSLTERFPARPEGHAGLAQVAMERELWTQALAHWNAA